METIAFGIIWKLFIEQLHTHPLHLLHKFDIIRCKVIYVLKMYFGYYLHVVFSAGIYVLECYN